MIYFVTNNTAYYSTAINSAIFSDIKVLSEEEGKSLYFKMFSKTRVLAFDIEATGLDAYHTTPLLWGIGDARNQFAFDWTCDISDIIKHAKKYNKTILGQNLKYDIKLTKVNTGVMLNNLYDTMIAEQRLYMKSGYWFGLDELVKRYCGKVISKSTRNDFIGADIKTFKISTSHLYYLKGDLVDLFEIRKKQQILIHRFSMELLIYGIEFPLIHIIAEAELDGFTLDVDKWRARLAEEIKQKYELEVKMDNFFREVRDMKSLHGHFERIDPKVSLGGHRYNNPRKHNPMYDIFNSDGTTTEVNLFGDFASHRDITRVKKKVVHNPNNVSYSNKTDIVRIFAGLEEPLPLSGGEHSAVPQFGSNGKLTSSVNDYTIKAEHLEKYILLRPDSAMREFLEMKIKHAQLEKGITTYGEAFINKIHSITGKLHTVFRQCDADTGRFQSGGGKREPDKINGQNVPAKKEYRNCFTVEDVEESSVLSADYSGAELAVMASHAQDFKLIEISQQDMHSFMATKCWRNIYTSRARKVLQLAKKNATAKLKEEYSKYVDLATNYTVSKATPDERTAFKPMTFENFLLLKCFDF